MFCYIFALSLRCLSVVNAPMFANLNTVVLHSFDVLRRGIETTWMNVGVSRKGCDPQFHLNKSNPWRFNIDLCTNPG